MSKRQQRKRPKVRATARSTRRQTGREAPPVEAYGGWVVSGDGRTVVGQCRCGEPAVVDCPECGPQCQGCFIRGA